MAPSTLCGGSPFSTNAPDATSEFIIHQRACCHIKASLTGYAQVAEEVMGLNRIVRTFGTENVEEKRYESWLDRLYHVGLRQSTGYGLFVASGHITIYATRVAALIAGCSMVRAGARRRSGPTPVTHQPLLLTGMCAESGLCGRACMNSTALTRAREGG